jgi:hypothetical protein
MSDAPLFTRETRDIAGPTFGRHARSEAELRRGAGRAARFTLRALLPTTATAVLVAIVVPAASAATITVSNTNDAGAGSLRQAIAEAAPGETIALPADTQHYAVTSAKLVIAKSLTITGAGPRSTVIDGMHTAPRVLEVTAGPVKVSGVTITGGDEGGVVLGEASLTLESVSVSGNGHEGDSAFGGGIETGSGPGTRLTVNASTIAENLAYNGGGIVNYSTATVITNSTVADNRAGGIGRKGEGGGILANQPLTLVNDTIVGNECFNGPGCGGGVERELTAKNTIIADNLAANDEHPGEVGSGNCSGTVTDAGPNLESGNECGFAAHMGFSNANPLLGPLADNGGPTDTEVPAENSPAIDAGTNAGCPGTDQRGVPRPQGARCDIGAVERTTPVAGAPLISAITSSTATLTATATPVFIGGSFSYRYGTTTAYGASTQALPLLEGLASEPAVATLSGLAPATSYHVQLVVSTPDGSATSEDATFTTASTPPSPTPTPTPTVTPLPRPSVSGVSQTATRWREGSKLATESRGSRHPKPPLGTTFKFLLNESASVKLSFLGKVSGRSVGHVCVAPTRRNREHRACERTVTAGVLSFTGTSGPDEVAFQGRISHSQTLRPGAYTLVITATNAAGQSSTPQKLSFTIVK